MTFSHNCIPYLKFWAFGIFNLFSDGHSIFCSLLVNPNCFRAHIIHFNDPSISYYETYIRYVVLSWVECTFTTLIQNLAQSLDFVEYHVTLPYDLLELHRLFTPSFWRFCCLNDTMHFVYRSLYTPCWNEARQLTMRKGQARIEEQILTNLSTNSWLTPNACPKLSRVRLR